MNVVLFASGSRYSEVILEELVKHRLVRAVVVPAARGTGWQRLVRSVLIWWAGRDFRSAVRRLRLPLIRFRGEADLTGVMADAFCVAAFPYLLKEEVRAKARAVFNVHPSLLPRHRGGDPLFWTYFCDDRECGVTVHLVDEGTDSGAIVAQDQMALPRGIRSNELSEQLARRGAVLLASVLGSPIQSRAQEESLATMEPLPRLGAWRIDWQIWPAERVWHFLRGVGTTHGHLLTDHRGERIPVGEAIHFTEGEHGRVPGTVARHLRGATIFCVDGTVDVRAISPIRRLAALRGRLTRYRDSTKTKPIRS